MKKIILLIFGLLMLNLNVNSQTTKQYAATDMQQLRNDLRNAKDGDIFVLTTPGGQYVVDTACLEVHANITIKAKDGLTKKPIVKMAHSGTGNTVDYFVRLYGDSVSVVLKGIEFQGDSTTTKYAIRTAKISDFGQYSSYADPNYDMKPVQVYDLTVNNCDINGIKKGSDGRGIILYPGTLGRKVLIENTTFSQIERDGIDAYLDTKRLKAHGHWKFVDDMQVKNCTFYNIGRQAIQIRSSDTSAVSAQNKVEIDHVTFDHCAWNNSDPGKYHTLKLDNVETVVTNSIFSNDVSDDYIFRLNYLYSSVNYIDVYYLGENGTGMTDTLKIAGHVPNMWALDPEYTDRSTGNFTLANDSPVLVKASDGHALGDLRWDPDYTTGVFHNKKNNSNILIYNSKNKIFIKSINSSLSGEIRIVNLMGQIVYYSRLSQSRRQSFDVELKTGVYIAQVNLVNGTVFSKKIAIQ